MNPIKMMLGASPDRKLIWALLIGGFAYLFGLRIPSPEEVAPAIEMITHGNEAVKQIAEAYHQEVLKNSGNTLELVIGLCAAVGPILYSYMSKQKEIKATTEGSGVVVSRSA